MSDLTQAELHAVTARLRAAGEPVLVLTEAKLLTGGRSNLTFRISGSQQSWVLRMPPRAGRTSSAHDVTREHQVTSALARSVAVPVPRPVLLCSEDESTLGGPYTVTEFVEGRAVRTSRDLDMLDDSTLDRVLDDLVEVLAALHRTDIAAAGLSGFGRPDGYAQRQLSRWSTQWETVGDAANDSAARALVALLGRRLPEQRSVSVVHGDYRLDNTLIRPAERRPIAAVVDWELSTIGDPVADVALMCAYRAPGFDLVQGVDTAWTSTRLPAPQDLAARYEAAGGRPLADWDEHLALAYFKIAVIAAGIAYRHTAGATSGSGTESAGDAVGPFLELGLAAAGART